jgi:hypothetical protein
MHKTDAGRVFIGTAMSDTLSRIVSVVGKRLRFAGGSESLSDRAVPDVACVSHIGYGAVSIFRRRKQWRRSKPRAKNNPPERENKTAP